jgi:hypothetical protein
MAIAGYDRIAMFPQDAPEKNAPLKREVARPPAHDRVFVQLLVLSTLPMVAGMASLWIGVFLGVAPTPVAIIQPIAVEQPIPVEQPAVLPSAVAQRAIPPTPPPAPLEPGFAFVFELDGASYLHLQDMDAIDLDEGTGEGDGDDVDEDVRPPRAPLPRHAQPVLVRMDGIPFAAMAAVQAGDLPEAIARWQGREVLVDSACRAHVTGFALVARVYSEDLSYDEQEQGLSPATLARSIFDDVGHLVLAAQLDGCKGSYAQPTDHPAVASDRPALATVARVLDSHPAESAAVLALRKSPAGRAAQRTWRENDYEGAWWQDAEVTTQVLQHPRTGETFVSVHALADVECGGLEINLWGMYRVGADGKLEPLAQRAVDNVHELDTFLDIDGDGRFEILASSLWGMDTFLLRADGSRQAMLHLPYYGCQC